MTQAVQETFPKPGFSPGSQRLQRDHTRVFSIRAIYGSAVDALSVFRDRLYFS